MCPPLFLIGAAEIKKIDTNGERGFLARDMDLSIVASERLESKGFRVAEKTRETNPGEEGGHVLQRGMGW